MIGLLISVPIVVWGSTVILKLVERFPMVVYIGAGALLWTAGKMILHEKFIANWIGDNTVIEAAAYVIIIGGGLAFGWMREKARRDKKTLKAG